MYGRPAGYSSEEDDYDDYFTCDSFSSPIVPPNSNRNLERESNETQLYRACIAGFIENAKEILDSGFDVNHQFRDEWTPLLLAASTGAAAVVRLLLDKGADATCHKDGYTALMAAAACSASTAPYEQSYEVVKMLLDAGSDPKGINRKRMTALMYAASTGNCLVVNELVQFDNKDVEDNQGWTALFWAVNSNRAEVVKILLNAGFNCDRMDIRGETPAECAVRHGHVDVVELLPSITLNSHETTHWSNKRSFDDFFDKGSDCFISDVCIILYGMNSESAIEKFVLSDVSLLEFLCMDEDKLKKLGIMMPYERCRILNGLFRFHRQPFRLKSIPVIKKEEQMSTANVAASIISACRQLVVMNASLRYLMENAENPDFTIYKTKIFDISEKLHKIAQVVKKLNERATKWDKENISPDLITINSLRGRTSWKKRLLKLGIASVLICIVFNKLKRS